MDATINALRGMGDCARILEIMTKRNLDVYPPEPLKVGDMAVQASRVPGDMLQISSSGNTSVVGLLGNRQYGVLHSSRRPDASERFAQAAAALRESLQRMEE